MVLIENDIDARPFPSQVLSCLPPLPWFVSSEDVANPVRQDLRQLCVFSVDPPGLCSIVIKIGICFIFLSDTFFLFVFLPFYGGDHEFISSCVELLPYIISFIFYGEGCKDIDDALHCTALSNGNFEVGVRILCSYCYSSNVLYHHIAFYAIFVNTCPQIWKVANTLIGSLLYFEKCFCYIFICELFISLLLIKYNYLKISRIIYSMHWCEDAAAYYLYCLYFNLAGSIYNGLENENPSQEKPLHMLNS